MFSQASIFYYYYYYYQSLIFDRQSLGQSTPILPQKKIQVPFSTTIGNVELMQECFPKHLFMGTTRMKLGKDTEKNVRREK